MSGAATGEVVAPTADKLLGMSDEDFLKMETPTAVVEETQVTKTQEELDAEAAAAQADKERADAEAAEAARLEQEKAAAAASGAGGTNDGKVTSAVEGQQGAVDPSATQVANPGTDESGKAKTEVQKDGAAKVTDPAGSTATGEAAPVNYEEVYKQIMAPFKANGKTIELKSPAEVIQLMQMGANYTRKMQDLQPHRKMLMMLENNGLMDEGKLSYLIDLDRKDPEAIKKLIKDSGIDPMEIDTAVEPAYREGNHKVSDEEASFRGVLDELSSTQEGKETLQVINTGWDQASKEALWKNPDVMQVMHEQRANGIYDRIAAEVERQRVLGVIPPTTPFIHAYKAVGDQLVAANGFADLIKAPPVTTQANPVVVATRVVPPKKVVTNGDQANAAASTRATPQQAAKFVNPLAMSDDEFLKQMQDRL